MSDENNDLRLYANEIMRRLYLAGERGQLEILQIYATRCIELLDEQKPAPGQTQEGSR